MVFKRGGKNRKNVEMFNCLIDLLLGPPCVVLSERLVGMGHAQ